MKLKARLLSVFLPAGIIPLVLLALLSLGIASSAIKEQTMAELEIMGQMKEKQLSAFFENCHTDLDSIAETVGVLRHEAFLKLEALGENRTNEINGYLEKAIGDMSTFAGSGDVSRFYKELVTYHVETKVKADGAYDVSTDAYQGIWKGHADFLVKYVEQSDFEDLYLVCTAHGHVMFAAGQDEVMGSNLRHGPFKASGLHQLLEKVASSEAPAIVDFSLFGKKQELVSFAGAPVLNEHGKMVGMLAVKISPKPIAKVMGSVIGLGDTGETFLVGPDGLMRSNSRHEPIFSLNQAIKQSNQKKIKSASVKALAQGKRGLGVVDSYREEAVLSFWKPLNFMDLDWGVVAEVAVSEAFCPEVVEKGQVTGRSYYDAFVTAKGYEDIYLINPDGFVFFSAKKAQDFGTNVLNGSFSHTALGQLVKQIKRTEKEEFSDFCNYEAKGGKTTLFAGEPILGERGVELIVVVELSASRLQSLVHQSADKEKQKEVLLLGPDGRLKADSALVPTDTVKASLSGKLEPFKEDERLAVLNAGQSGRGEFINRRNKSVYSVFKPVKVFDQQWAMFLEADTQIALKPVVRLRTFIAGLAILCGIVITIAGVSLAQIIVRPLAQTSKMLKEIAQGKGDLTARLALNRKDEIGELAEWFNEFMEKLQHIIKQTQETVLSTSSAAEELSTVSTQLSAGAEEMSVQAGTVASSTEQVATNIHSMASAAEEMSVNANSVSSAAEQLSVNMRTVNEAMNRVKAAFEAVDLEAAEAAEVAGIGEGKAKEASESVGRLKEAGDQIGKVTDLIKRVAEQTNLLALNATIEAASAGEAGKGFAVVANEIKELANQSGQAAEDIAKRILTMQESTGDTVRVISEVAEVILKISDKSVGISKSVEAQSEETEQITRSLKESSEGVEQIAKAISEVAVGANEVSHNSGEAAKGAQDVSTNIIGVNEAVTQSGAGIRQVNESAKLVAEQTGSLRTLVGGFKV